MKDAKEKIKKNLKSKNCECFDCAHIGHKNCRCCQ